MSWKEVTYQTEEIQELLSRVYAKKQQLDTKRPIPEIALQSIKESLLLEWTYNSNGIEGNSLTLRETKLILEEGITIKGKSLREHFEAVNHQEAIDQVEAWVQQQTKLGVSEILEIHKLVLQKIEKEFGGRFRNAGVRISGANFTPPNALKVSAYIEELMHWWDTEAQQLPLLVAASIFHHRFVWIHPFFDGNGRTVRLIFNLLLMQAGFPPAIILKNDRKKYYDALNKANTGNYEKLIQLILQSEERSLNLYLSNLENNYESYQSIANIALEPEIEYGFEYISLLARTGKIDAFKEGRNWVTSKESVMAYQSKHKKK